MGDRLIQSALAHVGLLEQDRVIELARDRARKAWPWWAWLGFVVSWQFPTNVMVATGLWLHIQAPFGWLLIGAGLLWYLVPLCAWLRWRRLVRLAMESVLCEKRIVPATCLRCGYDLRATPERCPECGALVPGREGVAIAAPARFAVRRCLAIPVATASVLTVLLPIFAVVIFWVYRR